MSTAPKPAARRRRARRAAAVVATIAGGLAAAVAAERYAVKRSRSNPDPDRGIELEERPGDERRVTSFDGTELAVNVIGPGRVPQDSPADGTVLVFAHGFSLDMSSWHYQWKRFSRDYRCVLFDQRGHGRSAAGTDRDYSLDALGHDLKAVLDATSPDGPVVLLGHSMGGMSILSFAALYPKEFTPQGRVKAVVLANTAAAEVLKSLIGGIGVRIDALFLAGVRRIGSKPERAKRLRKRALDSRGDLGYLVARLTNFGPHAPPSLVDYAVRVATRTPVEVWTDALAGIIELDLGHAIEHITVPALVTVGDVDRLTPPASALAIKRMLPDGRMFVFNGSGHCTMLERHTQFNRVVAGFLEEALEAEQEDTTPKRDERTPA